MIVSGRFAVTFYNNLPEIVSSKDVIHLFTLSWKFYLKFVYVLCQCEEKNYTSFGETIQF